MAKEMSNPAGSLSQMQNSIVYTQFKGDLPDADSQDSTSYVFQPILPFPLKQPGRHIIFRPLFVIFIFIFL